MALTAHVSTLTVNTKLICVLMGMRYELKNCLVLRVAIIIQSKAVYLCPSISGRSVCLYSLSLVVSRKELKQSLLLLLYASLLPSISVSTYSGVEICNSFHLQINVISQQEAYHVPRTGDRLQLATSAYFHVLHVTRLKHVRFHTSF